MYDLFLNLEVTSSLKEIAKTNDSLKGLPDMIIESNKQIVYLKLIEYFIFLYRKELLLSFIYLI